MTNHCRLFPVAVRQKPYLGTDVVITNETDEFDEFLIIVGKPIPKPLKCISIDLDIASPTVDARVVTVHSPTRSLRVDVHQFRHRWTRRLCPLARRTSLLGNRCPKAGV